MQGVKRQAPKYVGHNRTKFWWFYVESHWVQKEQA
jgi:hypothetical protein